MVETKRTPIEDFLDGFPMELAKQSPSRDLMICYFSVNNDDHSAHRYARRIAT